MPLNTPKMSKLKGYLITWLCLTTLPATFANNFAVNAQTQTYTATASAGLKPPPLPTGTTDLNKLNRCQNYSQHKIPCPAHTQKDNEVIEKYMASCLERESGDNVYSYSCWFFPTEMQVVKGKKKEVSCHKLSKPKYPCSYGFIVKPARQTRKSGDDAFITVEFVGKLPPAPVNGTSKGPYDVGYWLAIGFSRDLVMGDDLVIYCHPYMDRVQFPNGSEGEFPLYPDSIGVSANKYFTLGNGKQMYDVDKSKFSAKLGSVQRDLVLWEDFNGGFGSGSGWGVLYCKADVSTYFLFQSKYSITTGIEMDMERQREVYVFMGAGHCLHPECLGDHPDNSLADVARLTSPLAKHNNIWLLENDKVPLFVSIDRNKGVEWGSRPDYKGVVVGLGVIYFSLLGCNYIE